MPKYFGPNDPEAFVDYDGKKPPIKDFKECPVCKGYGGWNLQLNAYPLRPRLENNSINRHFYSHQKCNCNHCNGWGYVSQEITCDSHEWKFEKNLGRCYNRYKCAKCGLTKDVDSSD